MAWTTSDFLFDEGDAAAQPLRVGFLDIGVGGVGDTLFVVKRYKREKNTHTYAYLYIKYNIMCNNNM